MPPGLELLEDDIDDAPDIFIQMPRGILLLDYERQGLEPGTRAHVRSLTRVGSFEAPLHQGELAAMELGFSWGDLTRWSGLQAIGAIQKTQLNQLYYELPVLNSLGSLDCCAEAPPYGDLKRKANDTDSARPTKKLKSPDDDCTTDSQTVLQGAPYQLELLMLWLSQQSTSTQGFQRAGTKAFMAVASLLATRKYLVQHRCCHDMESILWCLVWYVTQGVAAWSEGSFYQVAGEKNNWIYTLTPHDLPEGIRPGSNPIWDLLPDTIYRYAGLQVEVLNLRTKPYSDKANMELINRGLPRPKQPSGEECKKKAKEEEIREEEDRLLAISA
ncbi:hypothetical protein EST38_g6087 [Candolleomyces aberdarensis]|uniref:Fungal-type protein kinase domain-containing protein n=1 Tax=Candolleomyces aberdarensis TaxID=2316362 RepID=A0A4Q2DKQ4_9AGAR|nr:hypothetical protein EST38_g6087 [Candolleomyces aberdarensis]